MERISTEKYLILDDENFTLIFSNLYVPLCRHSIKFVRNPEIAEEIVQEQFIYLWEKRHELKIRASFKSYLYTSVKNKSIDYLRSKFAKQKFVSEEFSFGIIDNTDPLKNIENGELDLMVTKAMDLLPDRCYTIFAMKRFGEFTNKQIARELNISEKTVENQVTIAFKKLRTVLGKSILLSGFSSLS